jgi:quercetin dioxygenase-like cupin family protein
MYVRHSLEIEAMEVSAGTGTTKRVLITPQDGPNFGMRLFVMQPGGGMPNHTNLVEHEQYVLKGRARIGIGSEVFEVNPGDAVHIPAEVPHWYQNIGDDPFEFLCMVPNQPDSIIILE